MTVPLVSVITIFLDEERYLEEAVESVFAQTFGDWELLLVDDGSTDRSTEIARTYAANHPDRIRYLEHPGRENRGMSASRNLGIQHARGRYVSYLDGDDVWIPEKLTEQVALIEAHPQAAMVFGPLEMWHSWSEDGADDYQYGVPRGELHPLHDRLVEPPEILCRFLERENLLPGGVLARREVLERALGEDAFRDANSDAIVHTKVCLRWAVYIAAKSWYRYRQHPQSTTKIAAAQGLRRENRLRFLTWVGDYLASEQVDDERVWRAWEQALWRCRHPLRFRLRHLIRRSRSLEAWIGLAGRAQPLLRAPAQRRRATPP